MEDLTGTHREEYFFTTAQDMSAIEVIDSYTGRWSIETTFQESRAYLGLARISHKLPTAVYSFAPIEPPTP